MLPVCMFGGGSVLFMPQSVKVVSVLLKYMSRHVCTEANLKHGNR